jgi:transketolase
LASEKISARVLDMHTLNPLDEAAVTAAAEETGAIVTVEEALTTGGLGGAVAEVTSAAKPVPVERIGFPGFLPTGSIKFLFEENGLTPSGIAAAARRAISRKKG